MKFAIVAAAFPITITALWALVRSRLARRLVAAPRHDRWHTTATPLLGGVGIFLGFVAAVGAALAVGAAPANGEVLGIVGGAAILFAAGLADDLFSLGPLPKLTAQALAAGAVLAGGTSIQLVHNDVLAAAIAVVWLVGMTNAFNRRRHRPPEPRRARPLPGARARVRRLPSVQPAPARGRLRLHG